MEQCRGSNRHRRSYANLLAKQHSRERLHNHSRGGASLIAKGEAIRFRAELITGARLYRSARRSWHFSTKVLLSEVLVNPVLIKIAKGQQVLVETE